MWCELVSGVLCCARVCWAGLGTWRIFFFASRRRHTRCAVVTGVQTCALPILTRAELTHDPFGMNVDPHFGRDARGEIVEIEAGELLRSEERRVGQECVSACRCRW